MVALKYVTLVSYGVDWRKKHSAVEESSILCVKLLSELQRLALYLTPTPTWPPTLHRKKILKAKNENKSRHMDSCSYVKEELVSSVGFFIIVYLHSLILQFYNKLRLS